MAAVQETVDRVRSIEVEAEKLVVSRSGPHATRHDRGA